jgi:hypothetical protein
MLEEWVLSVVENETFLYTELKNLVSGLAAINAFRWVTVCQLAHNADVALCRASQRRWR